MPTLHALVADDDPEMLQMVTQAVEELDADVTTASTGDELLTSLADARFDVIVTDVAMPWMTGLQAVHAARSAGLSTPIVVITASRDDKFAKQVTALGRDATILYKPFGVDQLHAAIRQVLAAPCADEAARRAAVDQTSVSETGLSAGFRSR